MVDTQVAVQIRHGFGKICSVLALSTALVAVVPVVFPSHSIAQAQASARFSRIDVSGNQRIAADTIRTIAGIPASKRVTPGQINDAVQNLYASGLFESVDVRPERGRLIIDVVENPTINRIAIEGNKRLKDEALLPLIGSVPRRAYSPTQAEADVAAIAQAYAQAGRLAARIKPKIIKRSDNRIDLVFEVREGRVVEVNRIGFTGNRVYSDRRLRRAIATKQAGLFRALIRKDTYIQDRVEFDKQKLTEFYKRRGYIDAEVLSSGADFSRQRNSFLLNFKVQEGQQYIFGDMTITSLEPDVSVDDYQRALKLKSGRPFDPRKVETTLERLDIIAYDKGLPFIQAVPRITRNDDTRTIDIEFELQRGARVFVERIDIEGNSTTLDRVIRRQFKVIEGDPFNRREIRQATDRIRGLDFFAKVEVDSREGSAPDQAVIDVNVEEKPTGSLGFGLSLGTDAGLGGTISLSENNFLGRGQKFSLALTTSKEDRTFDLSFAEPALFDRDLSAGFELFYRTTNSSFNSYDTVSVGFSPKIGFPIGKNSRLELSYRLSSDKITAENTVSQFTQDETGSKVSSAIGARYTLDRRNSPIDPTAGFVFSLDQKLAVLGGDQNYYRAVANAKTYRSFFNEEVVFSAELEGGVIHSLSGSSTRVFERFSLGGDKLRGFETYGIGPRDMNNNGAGTPFSEPLGGNFFAVARLEASFPIGLPEEYGVHGGLFFDIGSVWGLDNTTSSAGTSVDDSRQFRSAIGVSLFWDTALGPLRFNFSKPLKYIKGVDNTQSFNFTIATRF
ncbi:MAG: outer membrane protein assembly factor BamA [Rhodobacteraceae bacterium]|nr:outer membrane protein assembly factor BamA [Paracoccaceae bacterium]